MPTISSTSSGSGLDVRNLVDQLVAAEGGPVTSRLDRKEISIQEGLTAIGTFKGALLDFQSSLAPLRNTNAFKSITAMSSNEDKFTAAAEDNAVTGSYNIEIEQLAQSQKLKSQIFESEFDIVGTGTINIEFGKINNNSNTFEVNSKVPLKKIEIDSDNNSLLGIQDAINQADVGVRASIINDGSGYRLIFNSENTGLENSLRISIADDDVNNADQFGLSQLAYNPIINNNTDTTTNVESGQNLEEITQAKNALFSIDGISISNSKNEIANTIPGITLMLKKVTEGSIESFTVEKETSGIKQSIQSFVASYNELMSTVSTLTGYDADSGQAGPLAGDTSIRGIVEQIRRRLSTSFNGINENLGSLASIGIDSSREGALTLDEFKLDKALANHADEITHLFSAAVSTSDPKVTVSSTKIPNVNGIYNINVEQTPSSGSYTGLAASNFPASITQVPEKFSLSVDGAVSGDIFIPPRNFQSGAELASELQRLINADDNLKRSGADVSVNYINNAIKITSNSVGATSKVDVRSASQNLSALSGLIASQGEAGNDLRGRVNGYDLVGDENKLKLEGALSGVVLSVSGNQVGNRGDLIVTNGIAAILDDLTNSFLTNNGLLDSRIDGFNLKIKDVERQRADLVRKLEVSEERYLKQFSNLDAMLGKMRSTSNFLAEKLSATPLSTK